MLAIGHSTDDPAGATAWLVLCFAGFAIHYVEQSRNQREEPAAVEGIVQSAVKRKVAVIGETMWASGEAPSLEAANQAIPFFGFLMGLSSLGHSVWVFPARTSLLLSGCRGANVLIVDSASLPKLPADWKQVASSVMQNSQMLIHDRATYRLLEWNTDPSRASPSMTSGSQP